MNDKRVLKKLVRSTSSCTFKPIKKSRFRYDISNVDVKNKLDEGVSIKDCAELFKCSRNLIASIKNGSRNENKNKGSKAKVCSCCGIRRVGPKLHFLCWYCFKNEATDMDEHCVSKRIESELYF